MLPDGWEEGGEERTAAVAAVVGIDEECGAWRQVTGPCLRQWI